jgi:flagellar hook assembly protein FlgD
VKYIFDLSQNYPNPFNPSTRIDYSIPKRQHVKITVYNLLGQQVITLVDEVKPSGEHSIIWNGCDHRGEPVASGIYFYNLQTDGIAESRKMILLK